MSFDQLPAEILSELIGVHLRRVLSDEEYLGVRLWNKTCNDIVLHALFDLEGWRKRREWPQSNFSKVNVFVFRYWRAVYRKHWTLPTEQWTTETIDRLLENGPTDNSLDAYECRIQYAMQSTILHVSQHMDLASNRNESTFPPSTVEPLEGGSLAERVVYILCCAFSCLHGEWTWYLLKHSEVENHSHYSYSYPPPSALYKQTLDPQAWILCVAAYINDIDKVKHILQSIRLPYQANGNRALWRHRVSCNFQQFLVSDVRTRHSALLPAHASLEEQRWISMVSSALVIAASMGHTELATCIMQIEPYTIRNTFRTHLYRTSWRSAMGQAIAEERRPTFKAMLGQGWPLLTKTGYARMNYFSGIRIALESEQDDLNGHSIIEMLMDMNTAWQCPTVVDSMLQAAVKHNNINLANVVLDRLRKAQPKMFTYCWVDIDTPDVKGDSRRFALGTAALLGRPDFVHLLLQHHNIFDITCIEARECALHALTCRIPHPTDTHAQILVESLPYFHDIDVIGPLMRTILSSPSLAFIDAFVSNIDLTQRCRNDWIYEVNWTCRMRDRTRALYSSDTTATTNGDDNDKDTLVRVGEIALAIAICKSRFDVARNLLQNYNLRLEYLAPRIKDVPAALAHSTMTDFIEFAAGYDIEATKESSTDDLRIYNDWTFCSTLGTVEVEDMQNFQIPQTFRHGFQPGRSCDIP